MAGEGPYTKGAFYVAIVAVLASYLIAAATSRWWPFTVEPAPEPTTQQNCVNPVIRDHEDSDDRLRPPRDLSILWDRSETQPGRMSATIYWENVDPRTTFGLIEVTGRYGHGSPDDIPYRIDGRELPAEGLCGHWLRRYNKPDDDERGVFFDGLWPSEEYCFSVNSSDPGGGVQSPYPSIGTPAVCEKAPWNNQWGPPDKP